jgi:2,4-dienoyl-CoA reductase (NADPH2)
MAPLVAMRQPARVGPLTVRNRIVFAAHLTNYAVDGLPTARHAAYYGARAAGGAGLVITEEHSVHPGDLPYEKLIRGYDPAALPGYRLITEAVHAHGAAVRAQLNHNGGQSSGRYPRRPVWAPSAVPDPTFAEVPVAMTAAQIDELVAGYADEAGRCVAGGFDGVELQCSQPSVVRQFLSPALNQRDDDYGGPLRHRARFLLEVLDAVRAVVAPDHVVGFGWAVSTRSGTAASVPSWWRWRRCWPGPGESATSTARSESPARCSGASPRRWASPPATRCRWRPHCAPRPVYR